MSHRTEMLNEDDQIRFTQLWTDAQPVVRQYVASLVRDSWAVRDIVQNISLVLLRKFPEFDSQRPFVPWALGIAKFEILGHHRDSARNRMVCDTAFLDQYTAAWANVAAQQSDESAALQDCIRQLTGRSRDIIQRRYSDGETSAAIAEELKLSAANVRAILKRTRDLLKRCVEKQLRCEGGLT